MNVRGVGRNIWPLGRRMIGDKTTSDEFVYDILNPGEIRILELYREVDSGPTLSGTLRLQALRRDSTQQDYETLSYTWGSPKRTDSIVCNGKSLGITRNLAVGLPYLRYGSRPRRLWIDAICIDQSNVRERTKQVQLMRDIF